MKTYYMLTKPGIILGNVITTAGGFALASKGNIDYLLFLATMFGLGLVIASAGVSTIISIDLLTPKWNGPKIVHSLKGQYQHQRDCFLGDFRCCRHPYPCVYH